MNTTDIERKIDQIKTLIPFAVNDLNELKKRFKELGEKPKVAAIGLYNHGKSSILNVLIDDFDDVTFKVADKRETTEISSKDTGNFIYLDTPGLDAKRDDDRRVFDAIKKVDIILFVHNVATGELSRKEIEFFKMVQQYWKSSQEIMNKTIFVLSRIDQVSEEELDKISNKVREQILRFFKIYPYIIPVSAKRYKKGKKENKNLLIKKSNIEKLKQRIDTIILLNKKDIGLNKKYRIETLLNEIIKNTMKKLDNDLLYEYNKLKSEKSIFENKLIKDLERIDNTIEKMKFDLNNI